MVKFDCELPSVYVFEQEHGFDEYLAEKRSAARSVKLIAAASAVIAVLAAIPGYYLITIISGICAFMNLLSLLRVKRSAEEVFQKKGTVKKKFSFYTDGFSVESENYAAYFPYEKLSGIRECGEHIMLKTQNGTEFVIKKTDEDFIRFLNEKTSKK